MANTTATSIGRPTKAKASRISGVDPWRTLEALSFYRAAACIALLALATSDYRPPYFQGPNSALIDASLYAYLFLGAIFLVFVRGERPSWHWQAACQIGSDISFLVFLNFQAGGISSGIATLLVTPIAAGSLLLERRLAITPPAIATIALLAIELYLNLTQRSTEDKFTQAGMICAGLFIVAYSGSALSRRARESEKRARKALSDIAKLSALSESVIHKLQAGVIVIDHVGRIELMNRASRQLLGSEVNRGSEVSKSEPALWQRYLSWLADPTALMNNAIEFADNKSAWVQFYRLGEAGSSTLIILDDASRVAQQAQSLKLASLGRLTASIAHELRNPLAAIQNSAELLNESEYRATERQLLEIIQRQSKRLSEIILNILSLSRPLLTTPQPQPLEPLLRQIVTDWLNGSPSPHPKINLSFPSNNICAIIDASQLHQIVVNILQNSLNHYSKDNPLFIDISATPAKEHNRLFIDIQDNGTGIPETMTSQIFEPFFSTNHQGTGLGLFITREICAANSGTLELIPSQTGAHFRIGLPAGILR